MPRQSIVFAVIVSSLLAAAPASLGAPLDAGPAPSADFSWSPADLHAGETATFESGSSSGAPIVVYAWRFEGRDGEVEAFGPRVEHAFVHHGVFSVTHTVTDAYGRTAQIVRTLHVRNNAPVADFEALPSEARRGEAIHFADRSTDPDGDAIVAWAWDFGDGASATGPNASHAYSHLGAYAVTLTVHDVAGASASVTRQVRVVNAPPVVAATAEPARPVAGRPVWFNATAADPDGAGAVSFSWYFTDGVTATGASVIRSFASPGTYEATLVGTDEDGGRSEPVVVRVRVDSPSPVADFTWSPSSPIAGETVAFTDLSTPGSGAIRERRWDFGDGTTSAQRDPLHAWASHGTYAVSLTVTDTANRSATTTRTLVVNARPSAAFTATPSTVAPNEPVTFTDMSSDADGAIAAWHWSFGDGEAATTRDATHAYGAPGAYLVRLEVTDDRGARANATRLVHVVDRAPVAAFSFEPARPVEGSPVRFTSASHDPDGAPIVAWQWRFGDGATSAEESPTHVYATTGRYAASLRVSDGTSWSAPTYALVNVTAGHDVLVRVVAHLPDGRVADLAHPAVRAALLVGGVAVALAPAADGLEALVPAGAWVGGDAAVARVRDARYMDAPLETTRVLAPSVREVTLRLVLPLPLAATLDVAPGAPGPLAAVGIGGERAPDGTPVYADPQERFRGTGAVAFIDGAPAAGALVAVVARAAGTTAWCRIALVETDAQGAFSWVERDDHGCPALQAHAPGRYELRAVATLGSAPEGRSAPARAVVDPTGGALAGMLA